MEINNAKLNSNSMVYVATFDSDTEVRDVVPTIRNEAIRRCTDKLTKQQRYCVWRLLDYALKACYGKGVDSFNISVDANGKWSCDGGVHFSLSHCDSVVVVAVCADCVGVDIEAVDKFERHVNDKSFCNRVLNDGELNLLLNADAQYRAEMLAKIWTQKESLFKLHGNSAFVAKQYDTLANATHCELLDMGGKQYALAVATGNSDCVVCHRVKLQW